MILLLVVAAALGWSGDQTQANAPPNGNGSGHQHQGKVTPADRQAAAARASAAGLQPGVALSALAVPTAGGTPDYFGPYPNYANSPLPTSVSITGDGTGAAATATVDATTGAVTAVTITDGGSGYTFATVAIIGGGGTGADATATVDTTTGAVTAITVGNGGSGYNSVPGIRKFVDSLPGLGAANANDLGQYIPVAVADTTTYPGSDYFEIGLVQYTEKMHSDLPATTLRGYVQLETANVSGKHIALTYPNGTPIKDANGNQVYAVDNPSYLGPTIVAQKDRPVRVKFTNFLPTGSGGDLFIPVDTTVMGSGTGPNGGTENYTQNRATLHLHGGITPWISDGTPHQWTTPAGETTSYPKGVSVYDVPDMPDPGPGSLTFFYTNQQSARLMFYHDHAYGITRLNVYAGEAAGYLVQDPVEQGLVSSGVIPADQIPLVVQDKTFVPSTPQLTAEDPTWDTAKYGGYGNLWFPHVYMPNQNPYDLGGANAMGRWDYGPWFWPPYTGLANGPVPNPLAGTTPLEGPVNPGTPNPSIVPEAFMDTPVVNGTAYPSLTVQPKAYRFRILNASNDRFWNLQLYQAKSNGTMWDPTTGALVDANAGEVNMVPAVATPGYPPTWPTDGRAGGVPDPAAAGPKMIQIGTEGGFLPTPVQLANQPIDYVYNRRDIVVLNVSSKTLFLGPAERADVIVDFSQYAGKTLILYNDAPAPVPAFDPRNDYYTGDPDQTDTGGAPSTQQGYGPNTRTIMQIKVEGTADPAYDPAPLNAAFASTATTKGAFAASQDAPIVPQAAYNSAYNANYPADAFARIQDTTMSFFNGPLTGLTLTNGGAGYTSAPTVSLTGGGGTGATATATLAPRAVAGLTLTNGGSGYTSAPTVTLTGGGGAGASATATLATRFVASVTVTNGGNGYTSTPTVSFSGGGGTGATATATVVKRKVTGIAVTNGGSGYTSAPTVTISGGGGSGAGATATLAPAAVASLTLTNPGSGYTSAPTVGFSGGGGSGAAATATLAPAAVASITLTNGGSGYTSAPTVGFSGGGGTGAAAVASGLKMEMQPKAIQELFESDYGRMNALLGVEIPNTSATTQTTIPYAYIDPATEIIKAGDAAAPIGTLADGTQIWKITHNGVDTHALHWHMFNVQVINRVGWDGAVRPPDPNELGWKETVRMNPLEDIIVALRPIVPTLPFDLPNSLRPLDVTAPLGTTLQFTGVDPTGQPAPVTNQLLNFGWEYVWHCHLLGHEENDMMRPMIIAVAPKAPSNLAAILTGTKGKPKVTLTWTDNSLNETAFTVQRATAATGPWTTVTTVPSATGPGTGTTVTYNDTTVARGTTYYYRVIAKNVVGYTQTYAAPAAGYPNVSADSAPSGTSNQVITP